MSFSSKPPTGEEVRKYSKDTLEQTTPSTARQKEEQRKTERGTYSPRWLGEIGEVRTEIALDGTWLFKPDYEVRGDIRPMSPDGKDMDWHVMEVPQFWNPVRNWLYLQESGLPHAGSGVSDNYRKKEEMRCAAYTFDYTKTESAWYRQWITLPDKIQGKRFVLHFDAVAKIADVYVNGVYAGGNVGMFGYFDCDITNQVRPGANLIAVHVKVRTSAKSQYADREVARAVSVDITNDMLNSLPHGMFSGTEGGIWQPVKLIITNPVHISDIFAQVRTDGGDIHVTCTNPTGQAGQAQRHADDRKSGVGRSVVQIGTGNGRRDTGQRFGDLHISAERIIA